MATNATKTRREARGRVLLVDDDEELLRGLHRLLEAAGFAVEALSDPSGLDDVLRRGRFDAVVSDLRMPGLDGFGVVRAVRQRHGQVPVLLATADRDLESAVQAVEGGVFRYLLKPFDAGTLEAAVAEAVRSGRRARARETELGSLAAARRARRELGRRLERALAKRWMAYQPIVERRTGRTFAYEALLRTAEPGLTEPLEVFDAAEDLERLTEVGRLVRADVVAAVARMPEDVLVFVNVAPSDLEDPELYRPDEPLTGIARRVVVELTERGSLEQVPELTAKVERLRSLGFRVAVDDLGAGYAGLSSFVQLRPDLVKLDMSLVRGVDSDPVRRRLVQSILQASHDLGILVVAEGVETAGEHGALSDMGVDLLQGFFLGRPERTFEAEGAAAR